MTATLALAGNPNCGKTTLFNLLTGANQFVGNWPGVTVEKKEGKLKKHADVTVTDLPGIYSLSPYSPEEIIARNYLLSDSADVILNLIDGTNIERNLYLTTQLAELDIPMLVAVNMMDVVRKTGDRLDLEAMQARLGCPVVEISALKNEGIEAAVEQALALVGSRKDPTASPYSPAVQAAIEEIEAGLSPDLAHRRFYAVKLFERDEKITEQLHPAESVEAVIADVERQLDDDAESILTDERYTYISELVAQCFTQKSKARLSRSDKIDRIVTNRVLALPIFAAIMVIVYYISVSTVGAWVTDWTNDGLFGDGFHLFGIGTAQYEAEMTDYATENIWTSEMRALLQSAADAQVIGADDLLGAMEDGDFGAFDEAIGSFGDSLAEAGYDVSSLYDSAMENAPDTSEYGVWVPGIPVLLERGLTAVGCADWLQSLLLDGIVAGVGAVLGFVPQMFVLFLFLAFLESCGYMARIAFILDRIFRKFGLSGKSFIPMLVGSGCGVPGVMASRTIENERDRRMTIMTTTFIPCGAKMPIIALIASALFGGAWWIAPSAYFIGVAAIILSGIFLKKTPLFAGDPAPFVMELPAYHLPTVGALLRSMWERGSSFIRKAGTIILLSSILIWAGSRLGVVEGQFLFDAEMDLENSLLGLLGNAICWIFAPLGFGSIKATIATIMGLVAKEEVVGVFGVLDFEGLSQIAGYSFLVFNLLCAPCFAAIGAIRREMNSAKWTWFAIGYQCLFAYLVSFCIFNLGTMFTNGFNPLSILAILLILGVLFLLVRPQRTGKKATA